MPTENLERKPHLAECPVCGSTFGSTGTCWVVECSQCGLLSSSLPAYEDPGASSGYSAGDHAKAFGALRKRNARKSLNIVKPMLGASGEIVEVGSAQGFFLETAKEIGIRASGIEPNKGLYDYCRAAGHDVIQGFFPQALTGKVNGLIAFNDVFEHLPDVDEAMRNCAEALDGPSLLLINLPMRNGFFYRVASALNAIGISTPFERLWQVGTMSPHLFYFDENNLTALAEKHGFVLKQTIGLDSVSYTGLWERLRVTSNFNFLTSCMLYAANLVLVPATAVLPKDAKAFVFQKVL